MPGRRDGRIIVRPVLEKGRPLLREIFMIKTILTVLFLIFAVLMLRYKLRCDRLEDDLYWYRNFGLGMTDPHCMDAMTFWELLLMPWRKICERHPAMARHLEQKRSE